MSAHIERPVAQKIALRMMHGERVTVSAIKREFHMEHHRAALLLERAEEIRTGYMLLKFVRPAMAQVPS